MTYTVFGGTLNLAQSIICSVIVICHINKQTEAVLSSLQYWNVIRSIENTGSDDSVAVLFTGVVCYLSIMLTLCLSICIV